MPYFVGLDASKRATQICVIDESGAIVSEGVVPTEPKAINNFLRGAGRRYRRVGLEAWSLSAWLYAGLAKSGLPVICIETKQSSALLKAARVNKTDRNDARGIAEIMRAGLYKSVHVKSVESRKALGLLTARSVLRSKARDLDNAVRGVLLSFGLKLPKGADQSFATRVRNLTRRDPYLGELVEPLVRMREALRDEAIKLERRIRDLACSDEVCRRLMTAPAIGPLTALTYRAVIDEPKRFGRSRDVGPHLGLTPSIHQSGDVERRGHITRYGDRDLRRLLFLAALTQLRRSTKPSRLNSWGRQIAQRRGKMRAIVAIARRLAVTLHAMWISETDFRWTGEAA